MTFKLDRLKVLAWGLAAAMCLTACSEAAPDVPPIEQARAALKDGDGFGAELVLREMLAAGTKREEVAALIGEAELVQGQPVEARNWLGEGQFSTQTAGRGFHMLGRLEMREGNLPAAGAAFDKAMQFAPDDPRLWTDIGRLRFRGGEQAQAVDAAEKAVELGPKNAEALMFRGQLMRDAVGMSAAIPWFERAIAEDPDKLDLLAEYAATLGELGEARKMLAVVRKITALNPGYLRSYYIQAVTAARAGKFDLARKLLFRSGEYVNDSSAGVLLAGIIDLETGNYASASQGFDKLYRQQPENRRVRDLFAKALAMGGNHRELVYRLDGEARLTSATPYLRTLVARAHEALGDRDKAAVLIDLAVEKQNDDLIALRPFGEFDSRSARDARSGDDALSLVRSNIVDGNRQEALRIATAFQQRFEGSADALGLSGDAHLAARKTKEGLDLYARSARIRQFWPLAHRRVAALRALGEDAAAMALIENYLIGHPAAVQPAVVLARAQYDRGNLPRAAILLDNAMMFGGDRDPDILALRAVIALRMDQFAFARGFAERAAAIQPLHPASVQALSLVSKPPLSEALLAKLERIDGGQMVAAR
ncbi:tetratricopeptide repeat protein [Altererythrobacter sp.]|nr:tetratricopeptide repeat protein [Altererythrobacter sp.]